MKYSKLFPPEKNENTTTVHRDMKNKGQKRPFISTTH